MNQYEPNLESYDRERLLFEYIRNFPEKHHNALLKLIVPKFMAKTTFEKTRDALLEKQIITVTKHANMKFYAPALNYEKKIEQYIERTTNKSFHDIKLQIKYLETDFFHKNIDEKINIANLFFKNLLRADNGFTILDSIKDPKKTLYRDEHLTIQQLIHSMIVIIKKDKDFEIIFPSIMSFFSANYTIDEILT